LLSETRCAVYVRLPSPAQVSSTPSQSSGAVTPVPGRFSISRVATVKATMPSGTLMRNIQCQVAYVVIRPPARGAITGAMRPGQTT
jgi:hypothetical protein